MGNLRIALVGEYPPPFGGVSTNVLQLAEQLIRENYLIRVFASNQLSCDVPNYVRRYSLRSLNPSQNLHFKINEFKPDLIHSHQSTLDWRMGLISSLLKIPIIHHIYGERFPEQFAKLSLYKRSLLAFTAKHSCAMIAVSIDLSKFINTFRVPSERIYVVPCLLPLEVTPDYESFRINNRKELIIVTTGFYPFANPHYGFHLIPYVAKRLEEKGICFTWYLIGQASKQESDVFSQSLIENDLQNRVKFIGELNRSKMLNLLSEADIYVRTKYSDSFGVVIAEAHQLGCHCLYGDNNPYFQEGNRLTKYRTGDADSLTSKMLEIISEIKLDKPLHSESPFLMEAKANYEEIKRIYKEVVRQ